MSATATGVLSLDFISGTQVNADVAFNTLALKLEAYARGVVLNTSLVDPPGGESDGDVYYVGGTGINGWSGLDNQLVLYHQSAWIPLGTPEEGSTWYDVNQGGLYAYESSAWASVGGGSSNSFETINCPNGTDPVADSGTDTLNYVDGDGITITGNSGADSVTIAAGVCWGTVTCDTSNIVPANFGDGGSILGSGGIATTGNGAQTMIVSWNADNATINADDVTNNSNVDGTNVDDALNTLGSPLALPAAANVATSKLRPLWGQIVDGGQLATANDEVFAVFLGQLTADMTLDHIGTDVRTAGSGTNTTEVCFYTSPLAPNGAAQTLTRVGTPQTIGVLTGEQVNSTNIGASLNSGDFVWMVIRIDLTTSQPAYWALGGSYEGGHVLTKTGEASLGATITGLSLATANKNAEGPIMYAEIG